MHNDLSRSKFLVLLLLLTKFIIEYQENKISVIPLRYLNNFFYLFFLHSDFQFKFILKINKKKKKKKLLVQISSALKKKYKFKSTNVCPNK